ncbi:hypothetical protein DE4585_03840 [Mycobacteroides salmoniphilum]|uniref:Uncharacterized protein n=1 Tax=Mycobacteroides salmoniphilum TaxID=404941 RepID=A0A4R8S0L3_9MYCO|nr:hypothetical protein DE4585_03840 [Mycobacteroides salmoniphilum]
MNHQKLVHILRAACNIAHDKEVVVIGSQAILGSYDDSELSAAVVMSR